MADSVKIRITGDDSQYQQTLGGLEKKTQKAVSGFASTFKGMMASQLVTKGMSALTNGIRGAINAGMEFEASMSQVAAISGATGAELEALTATAKAYGESTKFTASQAAEALNYMALAGWDAQQSMDALGGVLDLAAASGMDLGAASDAVTDYLSAFGMEANQAGYMADLMAYAQSNANTSATQLADAYGNCASSMHAAGQDIETTTSMLMALANQGIKGSEAGTQMAAVMRDLTQKMENGHIMIGKTAVQVTDAAGNFRDLNDIMADVGKATQGMGSAEAASAIMTTFSARSVKAVQTILNEGIGAVSEYENALRSAEGTASDQAATMMDNLAGDVQIFQSALEGLQITASESFSGIARESVQMGTSMLDAINQAGKQGGLSGMLDAFNKQLPNVITKVSAMAGKVVQGVTRKLPDMIKGLVGTLPDLLAGAIEIAPQIAESLFDAAGAAVEQLISDLPRLVPQLAQGVGHLFESAVRGASNLVQHAFDGLSSLALDLGLRGMTLSEAVEAQLGNVDEQRVSDLTEYAGTIHYNFSNDVNVDVEGAVEEIQTAISTIQTTISGLPGLSPEQALEISNAILSGSGYTAMVAAFEAMQIPDAAGKAQAINDAVTLLLQATSNLDLPQEAINQVYQGILNGATTSEIAAILAAYGVPQDEAEAKAAEITSAAGALSEACLDLHLPQAVLTAVYESMGDGDAIADILSKYGVNVNEASGLAAKINTAAYLLKAACQNLGLPQAAVDEIQAALDAGAGESEIDAILQSYGVDSDTAAANAAQIVAASTEVSGACASLGLPKLALAGIRAALGDPAANIAAILQSYGVPEETAATAANQINAAVGDITLACMNLGLPADAVSTIMTAVGNGAAQSDIVNILTGYGVPEGTATETAASITAAAGQIEGAVQGIPVSDAVIASLWADADADKAMVMLGMQTLKLDPADYQDVIDSYSTAAGTLGATFSGLLNNLYQSLTDGIADNADDPNNTFAQAKAALDAFWASAYQAVQDWQQQQIAELEASGLTGDALTAAIDAVNTKAAGMVATLNECRTQVDNFANESAGAGIADVKAKYADLEGLAQKIIGVHAQIQAVTGELTVTGGGTHRTAVEQGLVGDQEGQIEAIAYTQQELQHALDVANESTAAALAEAETQFAGDTAGYAARRAEIMGELADKEAQAYSVYDAHMQAIVKGMLMADPEIMSKAGDAGYASAIAEQATELRDAISAAVAQAQEDHTGPLDFDFASFFADQDVDWDSIASSMGFGSSGELQTAIQTEMQNALANGENIDNSGLIQSLSGVTDGLSEAMTTAVGEMDLSGISETFTAAMGEDLDMSKLNEYIATGLEAIDMSATATPKGEELGTSFATGVTNKTPEAQTAGKNLAGAAGSATTSASAYASAYGGGGYVVDGLIAGLAAKKSQVIETARGIATAVASTIRGCLQIASPSRVMMEIGRYTGEGFEIGLSDSLRAAVRGAEGIVGTLNLAPKALPDFEAALSTAASGAYTAEAARPIYLNVNGKQLARVVTNDMQIAANNTSRRVALGVGK